MFDFKNINSFQVETSSYCNLACPLCPRHIMGTSVLTPGLRQRHIRSPQWIKFLENMDSIVTENNPCNMVFCGCHGDPCMTPDWEDIIIETAKRPYIIDVETNGSIQSAESWARVGKAMAEGEKKYPEMEKVITFSIDGLEDTNKLYRIGVKHDKVMANAKAYIDAGGKARWKFIVFKHNEHQVEEARQLAKDMGFWEFDKHVSTRNFEYNHAELEKKNKEALAHLPKDEVIEELLPSIEVETDIKKVAKIRKGIEQQESDTKTELNITEEGARIYKEVVESSDLSTISCDFKEDRMMYIDAEFLLWPCNHIAATKQEDMTHFNKLEKEYGEGWNSLAKHTPEEIFNHEYFQKILPMTWKDPSHKLCTYECQEMCGGGVSQKAWQASTNREEI